jgi:hypothetical protein
MQNAESKTSKNSFDSHIKQQISKVIIRLEIDDLNTKLTDLDQEALTSSRDVINSSNRNIFELFSYNCNQTFYFIIVLLWIFFKQNI